MQTWLSKTVANLTSHSSRKYGGCVCSNYTVYVIIYWFDDACKYSDYYHIKEYKLFHYTCQRIMTRFIIQVARTINQLSQKQQARLINYHKLQIPTAVHINRFVIVHFISCCAFDLQWIIGLVISIIYKWME